MPAKEIKELRHAGNLVEALELAKAELEQAPDNVWSKRNISWVYMDLAKEQLGDSEFEEYLEKMIALNMPEGETVFYEQLVWTLGKHISAIRKQGNSDKELEPIYHIFKMVKELPFPISGGLSYFLQILHKTFKSPGGTFPRAVFGDITHEKAYLEVMQWWSWDNFTDDDYKVKTYGGNQIMSLVEQVIIAYSKILLPGSIQNIEHDTNGENSDGQVDEAYEKIREISAQLIEKDQNRLKEHLPSLMPFLDRVIDQHPEYQYPIYYKVKLLQATGKNEQAKETILPFVKKKQRDFWAWDLMGDLNEPGSETQLACYCKAINIGANEQFLLGVRKKLANILIDKGNYPEAKYELEQILKIRRQNDWKVKGELKSIMDESWYQNTEAAATNDHFYVKYIPLAEDLLFSDIDEIPIAVEFVNRSKRVLNFVHNKDLYGFFSYRNLFIKPTIGQVYIVRMTSRGKDGLFTVHTIREPQQKIDMEIPALKAVSGPVKKNENQSFAFVEGCFISPVHVKQHQLKDGDAVSGQAILSFNKKKQDWGWKLVQIES
ncbi:tetratricopeptide repeat protein [Gilvibacter sp.]|uniref:tetratricopeptide repeat protein n=1 Tax=Gilvibacter sp. TaxID=2729997 RepID=UPI003B528E7C